MNGFPTFDLTGQVALVTGAARGLGNAISLALAHAELAVRPGGVQNWEPLLYVCHTCLHRGSPERAEDRKSVV